MDKEKQTTEIKPINQVTNILMNSIEYVVKELITKDIPFSLVLWNNNNWDNPLPEEILQKFPKEIKLDFKDDSLKHTYIDNENKIVLSTMFDNKEYLKMFAKNEVLALLDIKGNIIIINQYLKRDTKSTDIIIETGTNIKDNIDTKYYIKSLNMFKKNNIKYKNTINKLINELKD